MRAFELLLLLSWWPLSASIEPGARDASFPPLEVIEHEQRRAIARRDLRSLQRLLDDPGVLEDHPALGQTRSSFEVRSELQQLPAACALVSLRMTVHITRLLPEAEMPQGSGMRLKSADWRKAVERLEAHEAGHRRHALDASLALHRRLLALEPAADCGRFKRQLQSVQRMARVRLELRDDFYDQRTRHGTRGAD